MKHCISLSCKGSNLPVWLQHKSSDNKGFTASSETCTFGIRCFFFRKSHSEYGVLLENQCKQALVEEEDRKEQDEK